MKKSSMQPPDWPLKARYILVISLLCGLLLSLVPFMFAIDAFRSPDFCLRLLDVVLLYILVVSMFFSSIWFNLKWHRLSKLKKLLLNTLIYLSFTFLNIALHYPVWKITSPVPIQFYIKDEIVRNLIILLVSFFIVRFYVKATENQMLKEANSDLQNQHLNSQLTALMNQINPHFFFNTLNTLSGLVQENPEKSEVFIDKLSQVFRYILNMQENSQVSLAEEIRFAQDYAFLLKVRFEEKLIINFNLDPDNRTRVPSLCTQLLIENVIKHNRMNNQFPVSIWLTEENGCLKVCNTYYPQNSEYSFGLGLKNLNRRSELLSGKPILIDKTEDMFCVLVPLIQT
jgi:hypothetical protein